MNSIFKLFTFLTSKEWELTNKLCKRATVRLLESNKRILPIRKMFIYHYGLCEQKYSFGGKITVELTLEPSI